MKYTVIIVTASERNEQCELLGTTIVHLESAQETECEHLTTIAAPCLIQFEFWTAQQHTASDVLARRSVVINNHP